MKEKTLNAKFVAQGALIAALYVALTFVFAPISFGAIQIRIAELLTILPLFTPAAIPGLFVGCLLGNILGGAIIWDIIFGSIATLIGAVLGYLLRFNRWLVPIPAIVSNSVIVPFILKYGYGVDIHIALLIIYIAVGEIIGCYILGELFASAIIKRKDIRNIFQGDASKKVDPQEDSSENAERKESDYER